MVTTIILFVYTYGQRQPKVSLLYDNVLRWMRLTLVSAFPPLLYLGDTERVSIKQHQYGTILAAGRTYNVPGPRIVTPPPQVPTPIAVSSKLVDALDASVGLEAGTTPPSMSTFQSPPLL